MFLPFPHDMPAAERYSISLKRAVGSRQWSASRDRIPTEMDVPGIKPSRALRSKSRVHLRILLACLVALLVAHVSLSLAPRVLNGDGVAAPLDRCISEQSVLKFLDGKLVQSGGPVDGAGTGVETITVRKERISSLKVQPKTYGAQVIVVQFSLDHEGRQHLVEGSFVLTSSDDPELHYHGWERFVGRVVSSR